MPDLHRVDLASARPKDFLEKGLERYLSMRSAQKGRKARPKGPPKAVRDFEAVWGVAMPQELAQLHDLLGAHGYPSLRGWRPGISADERSLGVALPARGKNLMEQAILTAQQDTGAYPLVHLLTGTFGLGSDGGGNDYWLSLYPRAPRAKRPVLGWGSEEEDLRLEAADLSCFALRECLHDASDGAGEPERRGLAKAYRTLAGQVLDTTADELGLARFSERKGGSDDPATRAYERTRWLKGLLRGDGVASADELFQGELCPRFDQKLVASAKDSVPWALYALWASWFFGEEAFLSALRKQLSRHPGAVVQHALQLMGELCEGRNELGRLQDLGALRAEFQAMGFTVASRKRRRRARPKPSAPLRPGTVPAEATFDAEAQEWVLAPVDRQKRKHGRVTTWRLDGSLESHCDFRNGVAHGENERFHPSGRTSRRCTWVDGKLDGVDSWFRDDSPSPEGFPGGLPQGVRRMDYVMREGCSTNSLLYDARGRLVSEDLKPFPHRPKGVPPEAGFTSATRRWILGTTDTDYRRHGRWRWWSEDGEPDEEIVYSHGAVVEVRKLRPAET